MADQPMLAYIFPGQGVQRKGMGAGLFEREPQLVAQADEVLGYSTRSLCLEDPQGRLRQTEYAQPAIFLTNALHFLKLRAEVKESPSFFAGHSLGEISALWAAGSLEFATALRLVAKRGQIMGAVRGGAMLAVLGAEREELRAALQEFGTNTLVIANENSPKQMVLSGSKAEIEDIAPRLRRMSCVGSVVKLRTSGAFHSPQMQEARKEFAKALDDIKFLPIEVPVIANVSAQPYVAGLEKSTLERQMTDPVLWTDSIRYLYSRGVERFKEAGVGSVLTRLLEQIPRCEPSEHTSLQPTAPIRCSRADGSVIMQRVIEAWRDRPNVPMVTHHGRANVQTLPSKQFLSGVEQLGAALAKTVDVQRRVLLCYPQGNDATQALLACVWANVVAVPLPLSSAAQLDQKSKVIEAVMERSQATVLLCDPAIRVGLEPMAAAHGVRILSEDEIRQSDDMPAMPRAAKLDDLALILFTSGSTSHPKGVMLDHQTLLRTAEAPQWCVDHRDCLVSWLPQYHAFGITFGTLTPLVQGARVVTFSPEEFIAEPQIWFKLIDRYKATHTGAPNFAFEHCRRFIDPGAIEGLSLRSLRALVCGGDLINFAECERFIASFAKYGLSRTALTPNYGMSELGPITLSRLDETVRCLPLSEDALHERRIVETSAQGARRVVSCGVTDEETRVIAVDPETCRPCPAGQIGELWVKSNRRAQGYLGDAEATEATFNASLKSTGEGGFLRTGDSGFVRDHNVYLVGRIKDVVVVRGKNYDAGDLERRIADEVADAHDVTNMESGRRLPLAAFACESEESSRLVIVQEVLADRDVHAYAELTKAIVLAASRIYELEVFEVCLVRPSGIPATGSRKIQRSACRRAYVEGQLPMVWRSRNSESGEPGPAAVQTLGMTHEAGTLDRLKRCVLRPELGSRVDDLKPDEPLAGLGLDSIRYIRIARRFEREFGVTVGATLIHNYPTCAALCAFIAERGPAPTVGADKKTWRVYRDPAVLKILADCTEGRTPLSETVRLIREGY